MSSPATVAPAQRSFVLIKPDAIRRCLAGAVISRFEAKGLSIVAMELRHITGRAGRPALRRACRQGVLSAAPQVRDVRPIDCP